MKASGRMVAGLMDAAFAAFGTFLAGIVAVRALGTESLAVYAVLFSATVLAMVVPRQLHYIPSQLAANVQETIVAPLIRVDARRASFSTALTFLIVLVSGLTLLGRASWVTCLAMALTAGAYAVVSPLQDHVRSSLHLVGRHFSAAACSVTLAMTIAVGTVLALTHPKASLVDLVPFASLFLGNVVSLIVGAVLLRGVARNTDYRPAAFRVRSQFLVSEITVQAAWVGCNYGVLLLLGSSVLARLEAARVVASPISILVTALMTFMIPTIIRKRVPTTARPHGARNELLVTMGVLFGGGALYLLALGLFGGLVSTVLSKPLDYALWAARISEAMLEGAAVLLAVILFSMGRGRVAVANSAIAGGVGFGGTLALAAVLGPFALPVAQAVGMAAQLARAVVHLRRETRPAQLALLAAAAAAAPTSSPTHRKTPTSASR